VTAPNARPMASIPAQDSAANDNQANSDLLPNLMEPLREQEHTVLVADSSFSKTDHECAQLLSLQKENSIGINTQNNYISYWRGRSPTLIVLEFLIIILSTYAFSFLFTTPYCGFLYRCGCTWVWSGGVNKCNVHNTVGMPKCPWCIAPPNLGWIPMYGIPILVVIICCFVAFRFPKQRYWIVPFVGLLSWLVLEFCCALVWKLATGYPYFVLWSHPTQTANTMTQFNSIDDRYNEVQ